MKIIDAHMHYYNTEHFGPVAARSGYENTAACWQQICEDNQIVFAVAMGNTDYTSAKFGGVPPRLIDLAAPFDEEHYNQPANVGYCMGVNSMQITEQNAEQTAQEFERFIADPHCLGIKLYPGYNWVYVNDRRHWPLFELARAYKLPVAIHTGDTVWPSGLLKYAHPLTVDEAAVSFPEVQFVICHCGCPWFADAAEVASKNRNICVDLSGLIEGSPHPLYLFEQQEGFFSQLRTWLNYLGDYSKVLYGSDWPLVNIPLNIAMVARVVPEEHYDDVYYNNALRVYNKIGALLQD